MKETIRLSVFETNSSSVHTLTIKEGPQSIKDCFALAHPDVIEHIQEKGLLLENTTVVDSYSEPLIRFKKKLYSIIAYADPRGGETLEVCHLIQAINVLKEIADGIDSKLVIGDIIWDDNYNCNENYSKSFADDLYYKYSPIAGFLQLDTEEIANYLFIDESFAEEDDRDDYDRFPDETPEGFRRIELGWDF